jgi:hypothetical protein
MQLETIIHTLLSAAAILKTPLQDAAANSIRELFGAACGYLKRKLGENSEGARALDLAIEKPESAMRRAPLAEAIATAQLDRDEELLRLLEQLALLIAAEKRSVGQNVEVAGRQNKVFVAGHDVIHTERVVRRATVAPDETHITPEQRKRIRGLIGAVALQSAGDASRVNYAVGHSMLQRKFGVTSYALIPRERYSDALRFLRQQCAIRRRCVTGNRVG